MLLTDRAGKLLYHLVRQSEVPEDRCLRLEATSFGGRLSIGRAQPGDEIVSFDGERVLTLDAYTAEICVNRLLDFDGARLLFLDRN